MSRDSSGLVFLLTGSFLLLVSAVGPFVQRAVWSRNVRYTVTTHRLIVRDGRSAYRVASVHLNTLPPPVIFEESDGSGSLAFGAFPTFLDAFVGWRVRRTFASQGEPSRDPILWDVPDIKRVRDFVVHARKQPDGIYRV